MKTPQEQTALYTLLFRGATALLVAAVATGCNLLVAQARYCNSLTHMPRGNHAQSIASNGSQREDKKLLQRSQPCQHSEFRHVSVSERQSCGQNLCVPFLRTLLPPQVGESAPAMAANGETKTLISPGLLQLLLASNLQLLALSNFN